MTKASVRQYNEQQYGDRLRWRCALKTKGQSASNLEALVQDVVRQTLVSILDDPGLRLKMQEKAEEAAKLSQEAATESRQNAIGEGFTPVPNGVLDALARMNLPAHASRVLLCLWRRTFGTGEIEAKVSFDDWKKDTGLPGWHISRALDVLIQRQMVTKRRERRSLMYRFQEDSNIWRLVPPGVLSRYWPEKKRPNEGDGKGK